MSEEPMETIQRTLKECGGLTQFRLALTDWFRKEGRDYPWRRTRDPYAILVSEAMLQQTQIATVLGRGYYDRWMLTFPDWQTLAEASEEEVLKRWEGLGYYNRARNLWRTAKIVWHDLGGRFPEEAEAIRSLPGIGRYTAGAVVSFSFDRRAALVDGNVSRVLARIFACEEAVNATLGASLIWAWAEALVPEEEPGIFNSALMELGQRICRPGVPDCAACPVRGGCLARLRGETERFPIKRKRTAITAGEEHVLFAARGGRVYLCPETGGRRRGLWRLPEILDEEAVDLCELFRFDYPITRYRVTLHVYEAALNWIPPEEGSASGGGKWFESDERSGFPPLGSPYRKALVRIAELREGLDLRG